MAHGAPDWTRQIIVVIPTSTPAEAAVTKLDYVSITDTDYNTIASWTVATGKKGVLHVVEMDTDTYSKTLFQLTIAGVVQFTGIQILAALTLSYPDVQLAAGSVVLLEAKSSDGTDINVNGDIVGKEVG